MSAYFFHGELPHHAVIGFLHKADIYVQPSISEAFGIPVVEAMASGLPIVASRVGGLPELVKEGSTGILVEPDNADDLARAILLLLNDAVTRCEMGRTSRQIAVQRFSWDRAAQTIAAQYNSLGL